MKTLRACLVLLSFATLAPAGTVTVTSLSDGGAGSLRQAIANSAPGDTIDIPLGGTITLTSGELAITNDLTINGPGAASLAVSGNHASRVFNIGSSSATVTISGIAIRDGQAADGAGGGAGAHGGGLCNQGDLRLSHCVVIANASGNGGAGTPGGPGGAGGSGGGIYSLGPVTPAARPAAAPAARADGADTAAASTSPARSR